MTNMLYIPDTFNVPEKERALLQCFVDGELDSYSVKLKELEGQELSLPYIIELVKTVAQNKKLSYRKPLVLAGASHCLPCAWEDVQIGRDLYTVAPAYYLDLAISTFTRYPQSVNDFLQQVYATTDFESPVIVTVGGLDLYTGGYLVGATSELVESYCANFVRCIAMSLPGSYILPILPSKAISKEVRLLVNKLLHASSLEYNVTLLSCPEDLPALDDRHFQPNYLQYILDEL